MVRYFYAMQTHRVVALVTGPQASFELGCAAAVFRADRYRFSVCTERPGSIRTTEGFAMVVRSGLRALIAPTRSSYRAGCRSRRIRQTRSCARCSGRIAAARDW